MLMLILKHQKVMFSKETSLACILLKLRHASTTEHPTHQQSDFKRNSPKSKGCCSSQSLANFLSDELSRLHSVLHTVSQVFQELEFYCISWHNLKFCYQRF